MFAQSRNVTVAHVSTKFVQMSVMRAGEVVDVVAEGVEAVEVAFRTTVATGREIVAGVQEAGYVPPISFSFRVLILPKPS